MSRLLFIVALTSFHFVSGQSLASKYYSQINKAENEIIQGELDSALKIYYNVFEEFNYPFCRNIEQAFYISCYAKDQNYARLFLKKCVLNGLTFKQFDLYMKFWEKQNENSKLEVDYCGLRSNYIKNIDTVKLFKLIEFDVHRDLLVKHLKKSSKPFYFKEMKRIRDSYIQCIEDLGYPTERETGSFFSRELIKKLKKCNGEYCHRIPLEDWNGDFSKHGYVSLSDNDMQILSLKPGNWFLTHYINPKDHSELDTTLFRILEIGFDSLKYDPLIIVNAMESTRELKNEFALSYYSQLWAYELKFNYEKKFTLQNSVKKIIDKNRSRYFIRSLRQEELLYRALYNLKVKRSLDSELPLGESVDVKGAMKDEIALFFNIF